MNYLSVYETFVDDITNESLKSNYEGIDIEGVRDCFDYIMVDNENPNFFSVYLRDRNGLARCVGNFGQYVWAEDFAKTLLILAPLYLENRVERRYREGHRNE